MRKFPVIEIRRFRKDDVAAVAAIEKLTNPSPWSVEQFRAELDNPASRFDLLVVDNEVVAFLCAWIIVDEMQIQDVSTTPAFQRKGYASRLLEFTLANARKEGVGKVYLEVRRGNLPAQKLYKAFGFSVNGVRPNYYSDNEDALLMGLIL